MRFATVDVGGERRLAVVGDGGGALYDLAGLLCGSGLPVPSSLVEAALAATEIADAVTSAPGPEHALPPESARLLAPLPRPNRILAIGRNYAEHAREQGRDVTEEPIVFLKASTTVIGPGEPIAVPEWVGRVDYEGELLVVLGRGGKNVAEADAMGLVAGYTLFNDVTARDLQRADQKRGHPWFRAKSMDTFGPMGPHLVTADEIPDPHALRLTLRVNGDTRQDDTTASMVFRIPALVAFLSRFFALEPGDVIATGTPSGIGPLAPGDVVEVSSDGLGTLRNPVVAA